MWVKNFIKGMIYPNCRNSEVYRKFLIKKGAKIGEGTHFFDPVSTIVDSNCLQFITIGKYCKITRGVTILAHDFSYSILRRVYEDIPKKAAITTIGDNCFIGMNSIILMGSNIGDNVIIGAGSVVKRKNSKQ